MYFHQTVTGIIVEVLFQYFYKFKLYPTIIDF